MPGVWGRKKARTRGSGCAAPWFSELAPYQLLECMVVCIDYKFLVARSIFTPVCVKSQPSAGLRMLPRQALYTCRLLIALAPFAFAAAGSAWVLTAAARQPLPLLREAAAGAVASARKLLSPANATSAAYCAGTAAVTVVGVSFLGLVRHPTLPWDQG